MLFPSGESLPYHRPPLSKRYRKGEVEAEREGVQKFAASFEELLAEIEAKRKRSVEAA